MRVFRSNELLCTDTVSLLKARNYRWNSSRMRKYLLSAIVLYHLLFHYHHRYYENLENAYN